MVYSTEHTSHRSIRRSPERTRGVALDALFDLDKMWHGYTHATQRSDATEIVFESAEYRGGVTVATLIEGALLGIREERRAEGARAFQSIAKGRISGGRFSVCRLSRHSRRQLLRAPFRRGFFTDILRIPNQLELNLHPLRLCSNEIRFPSPLVSRQTAGMPVPLPEPTAFP